MSRSRLIGIFSVFTLVFGMATVQAPLSLAASVLLVDNANSSCSDTLGTPFCTIGAAAKKAIAGDTVSVNPGTYVEQVGVTVSGAVGSPITYTANGSGVVVLGTSDYSDAAGWTDAGAKVWSRPVTVAASPSQVLSDGTPLTKAANLLAMTPGSFYYDFGPAKLLYVEAVDPAGPNPAIGHALVGYRNNGFSLSAVHDVVVNGFKTSGQYNAGVNIQGSTGGVTISGVTAEASSSYGILAQNSTAVTVTGATALNNHSNGIVFKTTTASTIASSSSHNNGLHGISLQGGSGNIVAGNTSFGNADPVTRVATGIDVSAGSLGAIVERNTTYGNQDSGIQIYSGSADAIVRRNLTYDNGDHGVDCNNSAGESVVGNTVVNNPTAGINLEGTTGCINSVVGNNISSQNGTDPARTHGDIRVDAMSIPGTTVNRNVVFGPSSSPLYIWGAGSYSTLSSFRTASGQEPNGIVADPRFMNLAGRDLHLQNGSPAIDNADLTMPGAVAKDRDGRDPVDRVGVANTGAGTPDFADRGALECTAPSAPMEPTGVTAIAANAQASVSWTAPANDGGSAVTGYTVTAAPGGRTATTTGATTATVTGLTNGTPYTFTVTAKNAIGTSSLSVASAAVTPAAVPGSPTAVTATAGDAQAVVSWTAPVSNGGSPITSYTVTASPGGQTAQATGAATTATVTGLTNGTPYTFTVSATNAIGTSQASAPSAAVTPAALSTAPGAPTGVTATAGNAQAVVSWTPPASNGGSAVTGYTVTAAPGGRTATTTSAHSATVTGLTNGMAYTFTATATNAVGTGSASAPSSAVTLPSQVQLYITRVYYDLFNRAPDPTGLAGWTSALNGGTPRVAVANAITSSAEYRSKLITGSYAHYLGRTPDPGGLAGWLAAMGRGMTIEQMQSGFIASPEYYAKSGSTYAGWVTKLYADVLGRSAAPSEVAGWTSALSRGMGRDQVAMGFLLSTEHLTTVVNGYYVDLLGRGIDPSGQRTWVGILQAGGRDEAIIGGIIASAEYYGRV